MPAPSFAPAPWITKADLRFAGVVAAALAVLGAAAAPLWSAISPHSRAIVISSSVVIPDETEGFVSADGRFLVITALIGLVAGLVCWSRRSYRGPVVAAALAVGGTLGSAITALLGHQLSSGRGSGPVGTIIRLPVTLHAHGFIAVEGALALLVYLVGTLFVAPDDLGRPAEPVGPPGQSAGAGGDVQGLGGDGYGPGRPQDGQLAAQ